MAIKWDAVMALLRRRWGNLSERERWAAWLLMQYRAPYGWGRETPEAADCSGSVCMALYAATGLLVRLTADDLFRRVFTVKADGLGIRAAFFVKKGLAVHVAGIVDDGVVVNAQEGGARVWPLREVAAALLRDGAELVVRGLNRDALGKLAREGAGQDSLDPAFWNFFS